MPDAAGVYMGTPTLEEYRQLYEAALAFKQKAPWEWMYDDEIFGVRNPETGQIGYASIMGHMGEHLALALYLGSQGLYGYYQLAADEEEDNPDFLLEIPHLQASFEDRGQLRDKDRQVIKALGLKFRGRQEWPLFLSYVPGCIPWFLTPEEARFLTVALEQTIDLTERLKENRRLLEPPMPGQFLICNLTEQGWVDEWLEAEPVRLPLPLQLHEQSVAALRQRFPQEPSRLEVDLYGRVTIQDKEDSRPYLGYHLLLVDAASGFIVGGDILVAKPSLDEMWRQVPVRLLNAATLLGHLPSEIAVPRERLHTLLEPMAQQLGIRLYLSGRLPALEQAKRAFDRLG
jgi:hypothetical protein